MWGAKSPPKRGVGERAPSLGCFCAYIGGRRGISAPFIHPTQNPRFPPVVPPRLLGFKGLSRMNMSSAVAFYPFLGVIFDVKIRKIETELSPTFTQSFFQRRNAISES